MSDNISINYRFQATDSQTQVEPLYALANCSSVTLPGHQALLLDPRRGTRLVVTRDVAIALEFCSEFKSLPEHAAALVARMPELGGNTADVLRVLTGVRDAGLMIAAAEICERINQTADQTQHPAPARVFINTCDRPDCLQRLLESLPPQILPDLDRLYVIDNSRNDDNLECNAQLVQTFNAQHGSDLRYMGPGQQRQLLRELSEALPALRPQIRFLLDARQWEDQPSYGLSRNLCLLLSSGYRCVMLDDDVTCQRYIPADARAGIRFASPQRETRLEPRAETLPEGFVQDDSDPITAHLSCLGLTLGASLPLLGSERVVEQNLHGLAVREANDLSAGSRVMLTESGSLGDHGANDNSWMLYLETDQFSRLAEYPGGVSAALHSRWGWVGQSVATISRQGSISQVTGVDNTVLLPPYVPVFRGEDQLFGYMFNYLHPDSLALQYPWAVPHLPPGERSGKLESAASGAGIGLLCRYLADQLPENGGDCDTRLKLLADVIAAASRASDGQLVAIYRDSMAEYQAGSIRQLAEQLDGVDGLAPELAEVLHESTGELYNSLQQIDGPEQLFTSADRERLLSKARELLRDYARALRAWPSIRETAQALI